MSAITVTGLGKAYKQYPGRWSRLAEWMRPRQGPRHTLHWVLRDISFRVEPGESVGIIGINGAGKSTLLKLITGTTQPTTGSVQTAGRVAAMLELGMGFHPDFTGRQNVFMAAQLLGLDVDEIAALMPEIEAFAEIGDYIDQPVRIYSSGMQMRLGFSVATAKRPDVLIVDEALAVGDAAFQRKCFRRIEDFLATGTTLLFVSHDTETVKKLCSRALFIQADAPAQFGPAKQVCDTYERFLFGGGGPPKSDPSDLDAVPAAESARFDPSLVASCEMTYGNGRAAIISCWIEDLAGRRMNVVESGVGFRWCYRVIFNDTVDAPIFAMLLKTREGVALYGLDSTRFRTLPSQFATGDAVNVRFTLKNALAPGLYYLNCGVRSEADGGLEFLSRRVDSAILKVSSGSNSTAMLGLIEMGASIEIDSEAGVAEC